MGKRGRPALDVRPVTVRMSDGMLERIDQLVGGNQRAAFIRDAVEGELERREATGDAKAPGERVAD